MLFLVDEVWVVIRMDYIPGEIKFDELKTAEEIIDYIHHIGIEQEDFGRKILIDIFSPLNITDKYISDKFKEAGIDDPKKEQIKIFVDYLKLENYVGECWKEKQIKYDGYLPSDKKLLKEEKEKILKNFTLGDIFGERKVIATSEKKPKVRYKVLTNKLLLRQISGGNTVEKYVDDLIKKAEEALIEKYGVSGLTLTNNENKKPVLATC